MSRRRSRDENMDLSRGKMTVEEAGRRGGAKGGPRARELIEEGKEHENKPIHMMHEPHLKAWHGNLHKD